MKLDSQYLLLVAFRFLFVILGFGYVHPDAFFQSSEVVAADIFGFETVRTWEFDPSLPCRSILSPAIFSGIPFLILKGISYVYPFVISPYTLFYFPRLLMFFSSFILDSVVWELSGHDFDAIFTLGSSWVLYVLINNGFSNSIETILVAIALKLALKPKKNWTNHAIFGAFVAFGIFNRFTFSFFVFPLILYLLYEEIKNKGDWPSLLTGLISGFFFASMGIIIIDSVYYGSIAIKIDNKPFRWLDLLCPSFYQHLSQSLSSATLTSFSWTIAPFNSLQYNLKTENLSEHGNHLRITHLLWNMPLLFGPLAFFGLEPYYTWLDGKLGEMIGQPPAGAAKRAQANVGRMIKKKNAGKEEGGKEKEKEKEKRMKLPEGKFTTGKLAILGVIVSAIGFLSLASHQEMRFLYATLVPFVILGYKRIWGAESDIYTKIGWVTFNVLLLIVIGVHHQGGLVPTILKISSNPIEGATIHVVFFHTYMPPKHLFSIKEGKEKSPFVIHDLMGADVVELRKLLLRITEFYNFSPTDKIYVVAPALTNLETLKSMPIIHKQYFHLSMEEWPESFLDWFKLILNVYEYDVKYHKVVEEENF